MHRGAYVNLNETQHVALGRWDTPGKVGERTTVKIGPLDLGGWFVELIDTESYARAYPTQEQAEQVAKQLMAANGTEWSEVVVRTVPYTFGQERLQRSVGVARTRVLFLGAVGEPQVPVILAVAIRVLTLLILDTAAVLTVLAVLPRYALLPARPHGARLAISARLAVFPVLAVCPIDTISAVPAGRASFPLRPLELRVVKQVFRGRRHRFLAAILRGLLLGSQRVSQRINLVALPLHEIPEPRDPHRQHGNRDPHHPIQQPPSQHHTHGRATANTIDTMIIKTGSAIDAIIQRRLATRFSSACTMSSSS